ncbi:GNAT family N-acetyltransferase [Streptomyces sp. AA8]|nr:GNAT family N-acetyltransferase [Streptomyces telluris]
MDFMMQPLRTADIPALTELRKRVEHTDGTGVHADEADVHEELADPKIDKELNTTGVWRDGRLVAYAMVYTPDRVRDVVRFETGAAVDPDWRRQGLGAELVRWMRTRARAIHAERNDAMPGELLLSGVATNSGLAALATDTGFAPCRHWFGMTHDLHTGAVRNSALPANLRLVPFDMAHDEATRLAHNEAFQDHWDFTEADETEWRIWRTGNRSFRKELSALILDTDDQVAAYLLADEYTADTAATGQRSCTVAFLGIRRAHRGHGAARALLAHTLDEARRHGYDQAELVVDTAGTTGALSLYQDAGFTVNRRYITYAGPLN